MSTITTGSSMVSLKIKKVGDLDKIWVDIPVSSYLPVFLSGAQNIENIEKRIDHMYFKKSSEILEIRWAFKDDNDAYHIVKSPFLN